MPEPLAICLENLDPASSAERYLRCVAVPGRQAGLRVDRRGTVLWRSEHEVACELWVSLDDKLILYRPQGAVTVTVSRSGRSLVAPEGKPVVLLDRDELAVGTCRLRVHVHGPSPVVVAPSPLPVPDRTSGGALRSKAAAVALGAVLGAAGACVEVRQQPPAPPYVPREHSGEADAGAPPDEPDAGATTQADVPQDIEVRVAPPSVAVPPAEPPPPPPPPEPIEVRENPPGAPAHFPGEQGSQKHGPDDKDRE